MRKIHSAKTEYGAYTRDSTRYCFCGGGDSPPPAPTNTSQTVTQSNIPEWARPYAEDIFQRSGALSRTPYVPYGGDRVAQFSPLQQQAFVAAQNMQPSAQLQQGVDAAFGTSYDPYQQGAPYDPYATGQFTGATAQQYMEPYMQQVVDVQKREAQRASDIQHTVDQAAATRSGAFGGTRQAIVEAERQRNTAQQLGDIQVQGSQAAYNRGLQQFNNEQQLREQSRQYGAGFGQQERQLGEQARQYGAGLGLQGIQAGAQGAQMLFDQGKDAAATQQLFGTQQQQGVQDILSQRYQDFINQQNYPYKQLGFFSDIVRGTGQLSSGTSGAAVYQPPPSTVSQLAGLGTAALGLSNLSKTMGSKKGGRVSEAKIRKHNKAAGLAELAISRI